METVCHHKMAPIGGLDQSHNDWKMQTRHSSSMAAAVPEIILYCRHDGGNPLGSSEAPPIQ